MREKPSNPSSQPEGASEAAVREIELPIRAAIRSIRYGSVEIIIHDAKVLQLERNEKIRFEAAETRKGR